VELRIVPEAGEAIERRRPMRDEGEAQRSVEELVREQIADGFTEVG
jgi:hypothetical protein